MWKPYRTQVGVWERGSLKNTMKSFDFCSKNLQTCYLGGFFSDNSSSALSCKSFYIRKYNCLYIFIWFFCIFSETKCLFFWNSDLRIYPFCWDLCSVWDSQNNVPTFFLRSDPSDVNREDILNYISHWKDFLSLYKSRQLFPELLCCPTFSVCAVAKKYSTLFSAAVATCT